MIVLVFPTLLVLLALLALLVLLLLMLGGSMAVTLPG
jgi:hypothetical protein